MCLIGPFYLLLIVYVVVFNSELIFFTDFGLYWTIYLYGICLYDVLLVVVSIAYWSLVGEQDSRRRRS